MVIQTAKPRDPSAWLPHNLEAEQEVLGAILASNHALALIDLEPEDFYEPLHGRIFHATRHLISEGNAATPSTLAGYFNSDATLNEVGGIKYLTSLLFNQAVPMSIVSHAQLIRDFALRRRMLAIFETAMAECASPSYEYSAETIAHRVNEAVGQAGSAQIGQRISHVSEALEEAIDNANKLYAGVKDESRIGIGMARLEKITGGVRRGNLVLAGGRPGMGKTAFGISLALGAALQNHKVLFISLEMTKAEIAQRILSSGLYERGAVEYTRMRSGPMTDKEIMRMCDVHAESKPIPIWLDAHSNATMAQIQGAVTFQKMRSGLDLVIVDYLGLMAIDRERSKVDELGDISRGLKTMAMRNDVCVIALHQLNRALEHRDNKRPGLADLRDSGNLEQDADMVWFPYREAYYLQSEAEQATGTRQVEVNDRLRDVANLVEIIVAKNRHGQTGMVKMFCDIASNVIADQRPSSEEAFI